MLQSPAATLRTFDVDCADDVFPGHRLVVRGVADHGRSRDDLRAHDHNGNVECRMASLVFELVPGVTAAEEAAREPGSPCTVDATDDADAPLPWSTGGSGPTGLVARADRSTWADLPAARPGRTAARRGR